MVCDLAPALSGCDLICACDAFVAVLGAWKLITWFGFWRVIVSAIVTVLAAMLSEPLWLPAIFESEPVPLVAHWKAKLLLFAGLAGWLMAVLALVIVPIRIAIVWLCQFRITVYRNVNEARRPMIPFDILPGSSSSREPPDPRRARRIRRVLIVAAIAALPLAYFWLEVLKGIVLFLLYVWVFLNFPVTAFACVGAIVFAIGWYLPLWPSMARRKAWQRASVVLAIVIILHTGWFLFGWVAFHPLCRHKAGVGGTNSQHTLIGKLNPVYADRFERELIESLGNDAVHRSDADTILVRPVFGLLESRRIERVSESFGAKPMPPELADTKYGICRAIERNAFVDRRAVQWRAGWGLWLWVMCGRLPVGKGKTDVCANWSGAVMCPAC